MGVKVSVIVPTFNRTKTLVDAINSVLIQSVEDIELIVVDDASTENVEATVRSFADERVAYVRRHANGGAGAARNTGLSQARGDYIAFQDSDDLWLPGKLARQLSLFDCLPPEVGVVTGCKIVYGRAVDGTYGPGKVSLAPEGRPLTQAEDQVARLLGQNRLSVQNGLFRANCYLGRQWFDERLRANEDWEFAVRLAQNTIIFEDEEPVVLGYVSSDSISRNSRRQDLGLLRVLIANKRILREYPMQHAELRVDLARSLLRAGKRKSALRQLLVSCSTHPVAVLNAAFRKTVRSLRRK